MLSPFVYEEPVDPADLVDRGPEIEALVERALDARNSRLEGPRRYGKTSLLRAALARCELQGWIPISVNFLGVLTLDDVAERIERAYARQLDGRLKRWYTGLIRTLKPTLSGAPGGVGFAGRMDIVDEAPEAAHEHIVLDAHGVFRPRFGWRHSHWGIRAVEAGRGCL